MLVSIVIPTFNREADLRRALDSVVGQTHRHWQALVVDNHSTDHTRELVSSLNEPRISFLSIHNEGIIAASRNLGIANAQGECVAFLDSDDWWTPDKLEKSVRHIEGGADVVYHDLYLVRRLGRVFYRPTGFARQLRAPVFDDLLRHGNGLLNSSVVVRTSVLRSAGGLREDRDLVGIEDFDLWLRLARQTERFELLPQILGYYWLGGGNTTTPTRVLRTLAALESLYGEEGSLRASAWLPYTRGRAQYQLGSYREARAELAKLHVARTPIMLLLKAFYMRMRGGVR